jgi:hypothetical protein
MQRLASQASLETGRASTTHGLESPAKKAKIEKSTRSNTGDSNTADKFDALDDSDTDVAAEQRAYEMRRVWDAWAGQLPWDRSLSEVEQSCGVSRQTLADYYRRKIYPCRNILLQVLKDAGSSEGGRADSTLRETPLASVLLPQIKLVTPLLKENART